MATLNTTELATEFDCTPRTLRKFLRADAKAQGTTDTLPGKGSRYSIEKREVRSLRKRFDAWSIAQAAKVEGDSDTETPDEE